MTIEKLEIGDLVCDLNHENFAIVKESNESKCGKYYANYFLEEYDDPDLAIEVSDIDVDQF
jgi:hypothetical protein